MMDRQEYERELREIQRKHLDKIRQLYDHEWQPCLHDQCSQCHGTGMKEDGSMCIHAISCPCPRCTPRC